MYIYIYIYIYTYIYNIILYRTFGKHAIEVGSMISFLCI